MNRPIRIGVSLHPQHADFRDLRAAAVRAEEKGVDIVYTWDHFFPLTGDVIGKHFECWTTLASLAEVTERVEIGPLVTCNTYRNPHLLADMARTVDHISEGRVILGLGSGWFEHDYEEYEYPFGTAASRLRDLEASLSTIAKRLAKLNPPPVRAIPILIGGGGEKVTLRLTAEHADIWHGFGDAETIAHKNAVLDQWCEKVGRDPGDIERSSGANPLKLDQGDTLLEAGTTQITLSFGGPDYDMSMLDEWIAWRDEHNTHRV